MFLFSANHSGRPGVQPDFKTEKASRNKAISRNISGTTNKQNLIWWKMWYFFHLGTPKTSFLMINFPIIARNRRIFPQHAGSLFSIFKKDLPLHHGQLAKKDKFCKWDNGSLKNSKHMLRSSKNLSYRYTLEFSNL